MKKTILFAFQLLLLAIVANGQSPGLHPYNFYDDFGSSTSYDSTAWYSNVPIYSLTRNGDGKLTIHASAADPYYSSFGVNFQRPIDLSSNAVLDFNVENTGSKELVINYSLIDINNTILSIENDTGNGTWSNPKRVFSAVVEPLSVKQVQKDLSDGYAVKNWNCTDAWDCPSIRTDFDWEKVVGVIFTFNGGGPEFNGDVYFRQFKLGVPLCMEMTQPVVGVGTICENTNGVEYSVPLVSDATNYTWTVPDDASIVSGQGSNAITVNFGSKAGLISVRPSMEGCDGAIRSKKVELIKVFSNTTVNGPNAVCGNTDRTYSVVSDNSVTDYLWHVPEGASITKSEGNSATIKFASTSGDVYVELTNSCGTVESSKKSVVVDSVGDAPVVGKNGYLLTSSDASYYQWYRYNEPIEGANGKEFTITISGEYKVNISQDVCPNFSNSVFAAISMINGVNKTFVRDEFATVEPYTNVASGFPMIWWGSPVYQLTRNGDGKLKVDVTNGDPNWSSFGLQWASESTDSTLDLSNNANVHMIVENATDQDLDFWFQLTDINGVTVNVLKPEGEWEVWNAITAQALIPANTEKVIDIDLTGGIAIDWSNCMCPVAFDWTKVKNIIFQANPGAGNIYNTEMFNGTIYLKDFMLGTYIEQEGSSLKAAEARSYKWKRSGHFIEGANQRIFTPVQSGDYSVELEDIDGAKLESSNLSFVVTGIDHKQTQAYKVYPNPSDGIYNFSSEALSEVTITDGLGRNVLNEKGSLLQLDLTSLSKGFYYLKIKQGNEEFTEKLIKY